MSETHTSECATITDRIARIVADVRGIVTKSEADRYQAATAACGCEVSA